MDTNDCQKVTINQFNGLYRRGLTDETPPDHAIDCMNALLSKEGEWGSRPGTSLSFSFNHPVVRMFGSTISGILNLITCDGGGNLYLGTSNTPWLTVIGMFDFVGLNMFNKTFIAPITGGATSLYVWDGVHAPRLAAGTKPSNTMTAAAGGAGSGHVGPGKYKFVVSYITNTGFTTPPSTDATATVFNAAGGTNVTISNIPLGGASVVARQIFVTQGDQNEYFFIGAGLLNDNTTTTVTLNFYDTDLAISADDLFNLLETIPCGGATTGLQKYHGRLLVWGAERDLVRVSNSGDAESVDNVTGFIQLPTESDGNYISGAAVLNDVLYMTKFVGVFSTQDNAGVPSSWEVSVVDGTVGSTYYAISTVEVTQPGFSADNLLLFGTIGGLYIFNGSVIEPPLTYKIKDLWNSLNKNALQNITVAIDAFNQIIYVLMPVGDSILPNLLLAGFYSEGLNAKSIKWTRYCFPTPPKSIGMLNILDVDGALDAWYYFRFAGSDNNMYKLHNGYTSDSGTAIDAHYQTGLVPIQEGAVNVYRMIRSRITGPATVAIDLFVEDNAKVATPPTWSVAAGPGEDYARQINVMGEKLSVRLKIQAQFDKVKVNRIDIFGRPLFPQRPDRF